MLRMMSTLTFLKFKNIPVCQNISTSYYYYQTVLRVSLISKQRDLYQFRHITIYYCVNIWRLIQLAAGIITHGKQMSNGRSVTQSIRVTNQCMWPKYQWQCSMGIFLLSHLLPRLWLMQNNSHPTWTECIHLLSAIQIFMFFFMLHEWVSEWGAAPDRPVRSSEKTQTDERWKIMHGVGWN